MQEHQLRQSPVSSTGSSSRLGSPSAGSKGCLERTKKALRSASWRTIAMFGTGLIVLLLCIIVMIASFVPARRSTRHPMATSSVTSPSAHGLSTGAARSPSATPLVRPGSGTRLHALPDELLLPPNLNENTLGDGVLSQLDLYRVPLNYTLKVRATYTHDAQAFTQGLAPAALTDDGSRVRTLYESTGLRGQSLIKEVNLATGSTLRKIMMPRDHFGEGLAVLGDRLYVLTWQEGLVHIVNKTNFQPLGTRPLPKEIPEGWGLTVDETTGDLIVSDGSSTLFWINPSTFKVVKRLVIREAMWTNDERVRLAHSFFKPVHASVFQVADTDSTPGSDSVSASSSFFGSLLNRLRNAFNDLFDRGSSSSTTNTTPNDVSSASAVATPSSGASHSQLTEPTMIQPTPAVPHSEEADGLPTSETTRLSRTPAAANDIELRTQEVPMINELEWVEGRIFANIWFKESIAIINPRNGIVEGWIHANGLRPRSTLDEPNAVLNGIAYSSATKELFVTGKLWPLLYNVVVQAQ